MRTGPRVEPPGKRFGGAGEARQAGGKRRQDKKRDVQGEVADPKGQTRRVVFWRIGVRGKGGRIFFAPRIGISRKKGREGE